MENILKKLFNAKQNSSDEGLQLAIQFKKSHPLFKLPQAVLNTQEEGVYNLNHSLNLDTSKVSVTIEERLSEIDAQIALNKSDSIDSKESTSVDDTVLETTEQEVVEIATEKNTIQNTIQEVDENTLAKDNVDKEDYNPLIDGLNMDTSNDLESNKMTIVDGVVYDNDNSNVNIASDVEEESSKEQEEGVSILKESNQLDEGVDIKEKATVHAWDDVFGKIPAINSNEDTIDLQSENRSYLDWLKLTQNQSPKKNKKSKKNKKEISLDLTQESINLDITPGSVEDSDQIKRIDDFLEKLPNIRPNALGDSLEVFDNESLKGSKLELEDELLTETMAKMYVIQESFDKAIEVFQKLSLKYPEKSSYFANQIQRINDLK